MRIRLPNYHLLQSYYLIKYMSSFFTLESVTNLHINSYGDVHVILPCFICFFSARASWTCCTDFWLADFFATFSSTGASRPAAVYAFLFNCVFIWVLQTNIYVSLLLYTLLYIKEAVIYYDYKYIIFKYSSYHDSQIFYIFI